MSTFIRGPGNFVVPNWMVQPIPDLATVRSVITPAAIHKAIDLAKTWKLDASLTWTISGDYSNVATASLAGEVFSASPTTETELDTTNWGGFFFGPGTSTLMAAPYTFLDGAMSPSESIVGGGFGIAFSWIDMRRDRATLWETAELALQGSITAYSAGDAYELNGDGDSEPLDGGLVPGSIEAIITWETGEPGTPFFGTAVIDTTWSNDFGGAHYDYSLVGSVVVTPTFYWGYDGAINTTTGDEI